MVHPLETAYDATPDPRTLRPVLPIDADNINKADAESLPLIDEDNQGIDFGDDAAVAEEDDPPYELEAEEVEDDEGVLKQDQGADEAIDRLFDRTAPRDYFLQGLG